MPLHYYLAGKGFVTVYSDISQTIIHKWNHYFLSLDSSTFSCTKLKIGRPYRVQWALWKLWSQNMLIKIKS